MTTQLLLFTWWISILATQSATISKYVECIDVAGTDPSPNYMFYGLVSNATCPTGYDLTSCNAKKIDNIAASEGAYIDDSKGKLYCIAWSPWDMNNMSPPFGSNNRIRAYARCCNLTNYADSFQYDSSSFSSSSNDATVTAICDSNEHEQLIGCGGVVNADNEHLTGTYFDGSYAENKKHIGNTSQPFVITKNRCVTQNGPKGDEVMSEAQCYDTSTITDGYELKCISIWGHKSDINGIHTSTASCPVGHDLNYFMTSCSGFSDSAAIDSYYIENNICTVLDTGANFAYANAICCNMTKEISIQPTSAPTTSFSPTSAPTKHTTIYPSLGPTKNPSLYPSYNPSVSPTLLPSYNPSINPTNIPSNDPTIRLTYKPSISPTNKDDSKLVADRTHKPTTTTTNITQERTVSSRKHDENITESVNNPYDILSYVAVGIVLGCCICLLCTICICCKRKKNEKYSIDVKNVPIKKRVMFRSMVHNQLDTEKQNITLEMSDIAQVTSMSHDDDEGTGTGTGTGEDPIIMKETPGSNVMNDEFIIEDDMINPMTPGTVENEGIFMNNIMNDEVITASDEETPGTDDPEINDEQIIVSDNENMITIGNEHNEVIIEGSFNNNGAQGLMVGTPQ